MYRFLSFCIDIATTATADSAREPAYVKLLYTSDKYGQQIPSVSYDAGATKPHLTTPTRTHDKTIQNTQQTRDTPSIARACMRQAAEWPAYSAAIAGNSLQALDPPASTCTHARHASMQMQCAQGHAGGTSCQHRRCRPDHHSATAQGGVFFISR